MQREREGHGFSRAVKADDTSALAAEVMFLKRYGDSFRVHCSPLSVILTGVT